MCFVCLPGRGTLTPELFPTHNQSKTDNLELGKLLALGIIDPCSNCRDQEAQSELVLSPNRPTTLLCVWSRDQQGRGSARLDQALLSRPWRLRTFVAHSTPSFQR